MGKKICASNIVDIQENINQHEPYYQVTHISTTVQLFYKDKVERNLNLQHKEGIKG